MKFELKLLAVPRVFCFLLLWTVLAYAGFGQAAMPPKNVADALQPYVDNHMLAGAVILWADKDRALGLEAVGFADIAKGIRMKTDALFWIASMSKSMTATALLMLVDEGKVKLSDPVEQYLPEFHGQWLAVEQDAEHQLPSAKSKSKFTLGMPR